MNISISAYLPSHVINSTVYILAVLRVGVHFRLWMHVSEAVLQSDQESATREKCLLEDEQRKGARECKLKLVEWEPRFFERNLITGHWIYKYAE